MPFPRIFKGYPWKARWLLWLEGTGHRTCLAVQQQRLRYTDSNADLKHI
jgi:hypothetical protein